MENVELLGEISHKLTLILVLMNIWTLLAAAVFVHAIVCGPIDSK